MKKFIIFLTILLIAAAGLLYFMLTGPHMNDQPKLETFEKGMRQPPISSVIVEVQDTSGYSQLFESMSVKERHKYGKTYYGYYCKFCHGENGKGDGPVGRSYYPKPADLTKLDYTEFSEERLFKMMITGTGHDPVLQRVVPGKNYKFISSYIKLYGGSKR